jgi:hypothetical protein
MDYLKQRIDQLRGDLDDINREWRDIENSELSASQCYHFESDPPHFLFNTNCPDDLRKKLSGLLNKYFPKSESRLSE